MNRDRIYIKLDRITDEVIKRSQLRTKGMGEGTDDIAMTTDDTDSIHMFLAEAAPEIANRLGALGEFVIDEDQVVHTLTTEQTTQEWKYAKGLLRKAIVSYVLAEWYRSIGQTGLFSEFRAFYENQIEEYRTNTQQPSFVKPKYRPYF